VYTSRPASSLLAFRAAVSATVDRDGDVSYKPIFADPLREEIELNVPRETLGPTFRWHDSTEHLQVNLQGQHRSYRAATRDAAKNGIEADELFKIGVALSSSSVTLEDVTQMRKRLADTIVIWDTGQRSSNHGTGKNLLPSYEISNEHITLANTVKNVAGARYPGSNAELTALDKVLAEYAKIGEILRQLYAVRMSYQAEAIDHVLECILRARSIGDDDIAAAEATERAGALLAAQNDLEFIRDQTMALSAIFKAVYLTLPSILASRVLPDSSAKSLERETATLISVGELHKHKQQSKLRAGYTTAASASSSAKPKGKYTAEEKRKYAEEQKKKKTAKILSPGKSGAGKLRTPVSSRPPATSASRGAETSAERNKQQRRNDKSRLKAKERKRLAADGSDDDTGDAGDRGAGSSTSPGVARGISGSDGSSSGGKHPKAGSGNKRHKGRSKGSGN